MPRRAPIAVRVISSRARSVSGRRARCPGVLRRRNRAGHRPGLQAYRRIVPRSVAPGRWSSRLGVGATGPAPRPARLPGGLPRGLPRGLPATFAEHLLVEPGFIDCLSGRDSDAGRRKEVEAPAGRRQPLSRSAPAKASTSSLCWLKGGRSEERRRCRGGTRRRGCGQAGRDGSAAGSRSDRAGPGRRAPLVSVPRRPC